MYLFIALIWIIELDFTHQSEEYNKSQIMYKGYMFNLKRHLLHTKAPLQIDFNASHQTISESPKILKI